MLFKPSTYLSLIALTASLTTGALAGGWGGGNPKNDDNQGGNGWNPPNGNPPPKGQTVQIHPNYNWKKCLDVKDGNFYNGAPVDIYDCNGGAGQNWVLNQGNTRVQVAGQNFCLDAGDWPNNGSKMKIWNCYDGLAAQSWFYTDDKRIALKDKGFCLDLTNGDTCNGNVMQIWSCTNWNANQIWST